MTTSKVIVRIKGGLGNQLFCYAAARRLALANHAELVLDEVSGFARDHQYRRVCQLDCFNIPARKARAAERLEPAARLRRGIMRWSSGLRPFAGRRYLEQQSQDFDARLLDFRVRGTVHLEGYWQSEGYFKDVERIIRDDLQIKAPLDQANLNLARQIEDGNAVALHVRWFEPPGGSAGNNLSTSYYQRAVAFMEERVEAPHYFVFSDDPASAASRLALPRGRFTLISHNKGDEGACADLWLMARCRHFITANSTFSWWGAWLSGPDPKLILSPALTLEGVGAWGFKGLIPESWILI